MDQRNRVITPETLFSYEESIRICCGRESLKINLSQIPELIY